MGYRAIERRVEKIQREGEGGGFPCAGGVASGVEISGLREGRGEVFCCWGLKVLSWRFFPGRQRGGSVNRKGGVLCLEGLLAIHNANQNASTQKEVRG